MHDSEHEKRAPVLDPVDRVSEVIFGLLMAMTFVGSLSVATAGQEEERTMMIAAFGCNLAWGLTDAVMYLLRTLADRSRNRRLLQRLKDTPDAEAGRALIADTLPSRLAAAAGADGLEMLRRRLLDYATPVPPRLRLDDFKAALGIFLLVALATFPVVIPFILVEPAARAVRASNLIALGMLFLAGALLARYAGGNVWVGGCLMAITGTALIFAIMALGG